MNDQTKPDLAISYLEHRAMRLDAQRLARLVTAAHPGEGIRLAALGAWYGHYESAIHDHHRVEEAIIYPALLERDPSFAEADGQLEGEHHVLADRLAVARESLNGLADAAGGSRWEAEQDEAAKAATALVAIVETHLDHEEAVAFPRYAAAFTAAEFDNLGQAAWTLVGSRAIVFTGPWVLDHATADERTSLLGDQPLLVRLLYRWALRPRYARLAHPLRPGIQPAPTGSEM